MQVRVDDNINSFQRNPGCGKIIEQSHLRLVYALHLVAQLVADAGLDEHDVLAGAYDHRIQPDHDAVLLISSNSRAP